MYTKSTMIKKPNIYDYNDFRLYLRDIYNYRHLQDKMFSKSYICKKLGLPHSRSYFQDILNGKFLSPLKIPLIIEVFNLNKEEAQFFRALINYNQAIYDSEEREFLFEQLISLNRTPKVIISTKEYAYYKEWYHSVVRAVLNIIDFKKNGDYLKFARQIFPPITEAQIRSSIDLLLQLELIKENDQGFLKPTGKVITTNSYSQDEIIKLYQLKSLSIAREAILKNRTQSQRVITKMISISEDGYSRILNNVEKFNSEIDTIVHADENSAESVYQLDIVLFPHLKKGNK